MIKPRSVNPCSPGFRSSCALCCGSHNTRQDHENRAPRLNSLDVANARTLHNGSGSASPAAALYDDAMQCPHMEIIDSEQNRIGCAVYSDRSRCDSQTREFFERTCTTFYCRAWDLLTDGEILFAAKIMGDWYYYGLFIQDIALVRNLFSVHGGSGTVPADELSEIKRHLRLLIRPQ